MKRLYHYPAMIVLALFAALFAVIFEVCTFFLFGADEARDLL